EGAGMAGADEARPGQRVTQVKCGLDVIARGAEDAVTQAVHALVDRARLVAGAGAHPLQLRHVDAPARLQRALDDPMVAAGAEHRAALADDGSVAGALRDRQAP